MKVTFRLTSQLKDHYWLQHSTCSEFIWHLHARTILRDRGNLPLPSLHVETVKRKLCPLWAFNHNYVDNHGTSHIRNCQTVTLPINCPSWWLDTRFLRPAALSWLDLGVCARQLVWDGGVKPAGTCNPFSRALLKLALMSNGFPIVSLAWRQDTRSFRWNTHENIRMKRASFDVVVLSSHWLPRDYSHAVLVFTS